MYRSKEKPDFSSSSSFKSPYSRFNVKRSEATVGKILSKTRTSENSYGRNSKPTSINNFYSDPLESSDNFVETSVVYNDSYIYGNDVFEASNNNFYSENRPELNNLFRPKKPQLESFRKSRDSNEYSANQFDMKMMSLKDASDNSRKELNVLSKNNFPLKNRENLFRVFTGSVENILHWSKLKNSYQILFEVTGTLKAIQLGKWKCEKILILGEATTSPSLQVFYYEIDRPLPKLTIKSTVTCIGRLITRNRLHAFKVTESSEEWKTDSQRLSFICNRVAEEIVTATLKK